jgi:hypothetical protein
MYYSEAKVLALSAFLPTRFLRLDRLQDLRLRWPVQTLGVSERSHFMAHHRLLESVLDCRRAGIGPDHEWMPPGSALVWFAVRRRKVGRAGSLVASGLQGLFQRRLGLSAPITKLRPVLSIARPTCSRVRAIVFGLARQNSHSGSKGGSLLIDAL